jgi:protein-S-isoprenylcysteine O-methyltransferase Ste14
LFIPYRGEIEWKSRSAFVAFMLALFAEMFGIPLLLFVATPFFSHDAVPLHLGSLGTVYLFKHYFIFGFTGTVIGSYLSLAGMVIILVGWIQIHKAKSLVKTGMYKFIRHPQYTGIFLLITGWMLHWATTLTLLMYPFLLFMYYILSRKEEKDMIARFGDDYLQYKKVSGMYLPPVLRRKKQQSIT